MAQVPGLTACHSRARLAQFGEHWARDLVQRSVCHRPKPRASARPGEEEGSAACYTGWAGGPSGCPYRVAGEARKFPGAKGNSGRHPPCGIPGKGELACCLHRSPFLAGALGEIKGSHEGKVSLRDPCVAVSLWVGRGRSTGWHLWSEGLMHADFIHATFPFVTLGNPNMGGSWNRAQCECQGEDSGGQGVHMPLPGLVSLILSHQLFFLCLTFRKLFMNFIGSCEEVVSAVAVFPSYSCLPCSHFPKQPLC